MGYERVKNPSKYIFLLILAGLIIGACTQEPVQTATPQPHEQIVDSSLSETASVSTLEPTIPSTNTQQADGTEVPTQAYTETPTESVTEIGLTYESLPAPSDWEEWPELPVLSQEAIEIYQNGVKNGTDPHAFSIFGDCQSLPDAFWGRYDDPDFSLSEEHNAYQSTIDWFSGSFDRDSVTIKKGTTAAAILWVGWLDDEDHPCEYGETPLECELRIQNPSLVIISLGTHWELRNDQYLRRIIEQLLENGVLPVISTKADQREGEAWVNEEMISIAKEYNLPVWNFWAAVQSLENHGMKEGDTMYVNEEGLDMQRISGLKMLNTLLQQLQSEE